MKPHNRTLTFSLDGTPFLCVALSDAEWRWLESQAPNELHYLLRADAPQFFAALARFLGTGVRKGEVDKRFALGELARILRDYCESAEDTARILEATPTVADEPYFTAHSASAPYYARPEPWHSNTELGALHIHSILSAWWHCAQAVRALSSEHVRFGATSAMHDALHALSPVAKSLDDQVTAMLHGATGALDWHADVISAWSTQVETNGRPGLLVHVAAVGTVPAETCPQCVIRHSPIQHGLRPYAQDCPLCLSEWARDTEASL